MALIGHCLPYSYIDNIFCTMHVTCLEHDRVNFIILYIVRLRIASINTSVYTSR